MRVAGDRCLDSFLWSLVMEVDDLDPTLIYVVAWRFEFNLGVGFDR